MCGQDIATALQLLDFVKRIKDPNCGPRGYKLALCVDWKLVESHAAKVAASKTRIPLDVDALRWTPLVYSYADEEGDGSPQINESVSPIRKTSLPPAISTTGKRSSDVKSRKDVQKKSSKRKQYEPKKSNSKGAFVQDSEHEEEDVEEEEEKVSESEDTEYENKRDDDDDHDVGHPLNGVPKEERRDDERKSSKKPNKKENRRTETPQPAKRGRKRKSTVDSLTDEDGGQNEQVKLKIFGKVLKARAKAAVKNEEMKRPSVDSTTSPKRLRRQSDAVVKSEEVITESTASAGEKSVSRLVMRGSTSDTPPSGGTQNSPEAPHSRSRSPRRKIVAKDEKDDAKEKEKEQVDPEKQRKDREARYNRRQSKRSVDGTEHEVEKDPAESNQTVNPVMKKKIRSLDSVDISRPKLSPASSSGGTKKGKKVRRYKGYRYWGAPPSSAKRKRSLLLLWLQRVQLEGKVLPNVKH